MWRTWIIAGSSLAALIMAAGAGSAYAQNAVFLTPTLVDASAPVRDMLSKTTEHASQNIEGAGKALRLVYTTTSPLEVYIFPLHDDGSFDPSEVMSLTLPTGEKREAFIDLTVSPAWSIASKKYSIDFLSTTANTEGSFYALEMVPATAATLLTVPLAQVMSPEPFTPSIFHALRGYKLLNTPLVGVLAAFALIGARLAVIIARRPKGPTIAVGILVAATLLYQVRFSVDLLRFTHEHLGSWYTDGTYDEAQAINVVAAYVRKNLQSDDKTRIYVCRDGTNFKEKLLRYFIYPTPVNATDPMALIATHVLVMNRITWSFQKTGTGPEGTLTCGKQVFKAVSLQAFSDESELFHIVSRVP